MGKQMMKVGFLGLGGIILVSALMLTSCQKGFDNDETFSSTVRDSQLASPSLSKANFATLVNSDGSESVKVTWDAVMGAGGYYYRFPNQGCDVIGFGDYATTPARFREVMSQKGFVCDKPKGAYIYLSNDYPLHDHVILIGDAGGFAHRTTCEGLYDAFRTAQNAADAIVSGRPFREVNADIFRKKKKEVQLTKLFFSSFGFLLVKTSCAFPKLIKHIFEAKMRGERLFRF